MKKVVLIDAVALLEKEMTLLSLDDMKVVSSYWILVAPVIDPVHAAGAVYCRECRWKLKCSHHKEEEGGIFGDDDFCSFGEPKG